MNREAERLAKGMQIDISLDSEDNHLHLDFIHPFGRKIAITSKDARFLAHALLHQANVLDERHELRTKRTGLENQESNQNNQTNTKEI